MADEKERKPGIFYFYGTKICLGTTARARPRPLYKVEGGSVDSLTPASKELDEGVVEQIIPNVRKIQQIIDRHSIYSSPQPIPASETRYGKLGGWQAVREADRGRIIYGD